MHTRHRYLCMQVFVKCRVVHNNLHCKPSKMMLWLPTYGRLDERLDERLIGRLIIGPGQWLWLFKRSGQVQSQPRSTFWPGLAWPDFGLAWLGFWLQAKASTALGDCWREKLKCWWQQWWSKLVSTWAQRWNSRFMTGYPICAQLCRFLLPRLCPCQGHASFLLTL